MASKRRMEDPLEHPESSDEEFSSEETPSPPPASPKPPSSSSAGSGSGSETQSPSPPPIQVPEKFKNARSKPPSTPVKRPAEAQLETKDSKRRRKSVGGGASEKARPRVWSDEDEIGVLKGWIEFQEKKPVEMSAFYDFIKNSLRADVSKTQVSDKLRHLKTKYLTMLEKQKSENGIVLKPHEKELFDLSKIIWGESSGNHSEGKTNGSSTLHAHKSEQPASVGAPSTAFVEILSSDIHVGIRDFVMEKGLDLIEGSDKAELMNRWAKLRKSELEVYVERCELMYKQAKLLLEALA